MSIVILDRDGVINYDSPDYIKSAEEWRPLPGSLEAIAALTKRGIRVFLATNQAGLARKRFTLSDLTAIHEKMRKQLKAMGGSIEGIFYCPHHPDEKCLCRKPETGLLEQIAEQSGESLSGTPFVGDSLKDIQAGLKMACKPVLVKTGNGLKTLSELEALVDRTNIEIYDNLQDFVKHYLA